MAPAEALGAIAVHSIRKGDLVLKKGTRIGEAEAAALQAAGIDEIVVARIEPGDVPEDEAAADIAAAVAGEGVRVDRAFTGRANLFAEAAGVLLLDRAAIDRLNRVDPAITLATLPAFAPVVAGKMIATVKIIPFAVEARSRDRAMVVADETKPLVRVAPYRVKQIGVVSTLLPGLADKVIEKTLKILGDRIAPAGAAIVAERRVPHESRALAQALDEVLQAGAGLVVKGEDIAGMGVGGLLMEIVTRPQPRELPPPAAPAPSAGRSVAAIVLAAGRSTRMGGPNKLLEMISGKPLVRIAAEQALSSRASPVVVVSGHERARVEAALAGLDVRLVHNPDYPQGLSTSVKAGLAALPLESEAAIVCLGDMPQVTSALIDRLIAAFDPERNALVVLPTFSGKRGNPVLWSRRFFPELIALEGDVGARHLIGAYPEVVTEVPVENAAAMVDIDTPDALRAAKAEMERA